MFEEIYESEIDVQAVTVSHLSVEYHNGVVEVMFQGVFRPAGHRHGWPCAMRERTRLDECIVLGVLLRLPLT